MDKQKACDGISALRTRLRDLAPLNSDEITAFLTPIQNGIFGIAGAAALSQNLFEEMALDAGSEHDRPAIRSRLSGNLDAIATIIGCAQRS